MRELLTPEHRMIATQLREEARCWPWRRQLIEHHLRVLTNEQGDVETVLWKSIRDTPRIKVALAPGGDISVAVRRLRDALAEADKMLSNDELGSAEACCEQCEQAITKLRRIGRELGVLPNEEEAT
jgi:hypothetical protein